jgi:ABC-type antimicrobial peptide transport system permease subunit
MDAVIGSTVSQPRLRAFVVGLFGGLAVLLAALGIYGVTAHAVTMRQREFGIRLALGAQKAKLLSLVMGHGMRLALLGVGIGLVGALALTRVIQGLLFDIAASDPLTFVNRNLFPSMDFPGSSVAGRTFGGHSPLILAR